MPKQTFKCGYCKAEIEKGAKKCPKCGKEFGKRVDMVQPFTLTSGIITGIMLLFLGYIITLGRWPIITFLIILLIGVLIPVFWKKKRKIILQRDIVITPALLLGFIVGISGLRIQPKNIVFIFILTAIIYSCFVVVTFLKRTIKYKIHDRLSKVVGYIIGICIYIPFGILMIWANLNYNIRNNSSELTFAIFGLILVIFGFLSIYYASKISK